MSIKSVLRLGATLGLAMLFVFGYLLFLSAPSRAAPGELYVAPAGNCGSASPCFAALQEALDAAQANDEIRVAAGMYPIQVGESQIARVEKSVAIKGGYTTSDWTTPDPVANPTILNGLSQGRVMVISGTLDVSLQGLRLVYGSAEGLGGYQICYSEHDAGGGLYIRNAAVTIDQTWIMTNTTPDNGYGGGIYAADAVITMTNGTTVQANYGGAGGGLYLNHTHASLEQAAIVDNHAGGPWGGCQHGGGGFNIVGGSQVEIMESTIHGNRKLITTHGAGVLFESGRLEITDSLIEENEGSAVVVAGFSGSQGADAILSGNVIQDNEGSGVSTAFVTANNAITMTDNTVQGNHTDGFGAGISIGTRATLISNSILNNRTSGNSSFKGGGVFLNGSENSPILFQGNVVRGNSSSIASGGRGGGIYVEGVNVTLDGNTIQGNSANAGILDYSGSGGGIYVAGDVTLMNNIVTDNGVGGPAGHGAGITVAGAAPTLYHNTITRNTGGSGSGLYVTYSGQPGLPVLYNTIIAEQSIGVEVNSASPQNIATLYGILWSENISNTTGTAFMFDELTGDPSFVDPDGLDYHVSQSSAAIDVGRTDGGVSGDVDGETRPHYAGYDMGADEWWPLAARKSASSETAQAGDIVTYTLTLRNVTSAPIQASLDDVLPAGVAYLGPLVYNDGSGSYADGTVSWSGTVLTGMQVVIFWPVQVDEGVSGEITNLAAVSDAFGDYNTTPVTVTVPVVVDERYLYLPMVVR